MAEEFEKKILFSAESKLGDVRQELLDLNKVLEDQLTTQKVLALQGKQNTEAYINISSQVRLTKQAIRDSNREFDNASKALKSNSGSIQQNRALLSTLSQELIRAEQSQGKMSASTLKLKANVEQLTQTLKEQEKGFTTSRNVGNYKSDIEAALSTMSGAIPGFQQYGNVARTVVQGFSMLPKAIAEAGRAITNFTGNEGRAVIQGYGAFTQSAVKNAEAVEKSTVAIENEAVAVASVTPAAGEAAAGMGALTAGTVATGGAIAALVVIIAGAVQWFSSLGSVGIKTGQIINGAKGAAEAFFNSISKGDSIQSMVKNMKDAYNGGVELKKGMQALEATEQKTDLTVAKYDNMIAKNMLDLKYRKISFEEAKRIDKETGQMEEDRLKVKEENNRKAYALTVEQGLNSKAVGVIEKGVIRDMLYNADQAQIIALEHNDKINAGTAKQLHDLSMQRLAIQNEADQSESKSRNRMAVIEQRFGKGAAKMLDTQTRENAQAQANLRQAEQAMNQSIARQLESRMSAYGKELAATDAHYQAMIFKQMEFVANQQKLAKLAKDPEAKKKFEQAGKEGLKAIDQFKKEWGTALDTTVEQNQDKIYHLVTAAQNELKQAAVANIDDQYAREKEGLKLQEDVRKQSYEEERANRLQEINKLNQDAAIATRNGNTEEANALRAQVFQLQKIQDNADKIRQEQADATEKAIEKIKKKHADALQNAADQNAIDSAKPGSKAFYQAQKDQVNDQADQQIAAATQTPDAQSGLVEDTSGIRAAANRKTTDIDKASVLERKKFEIDMAKETANTLATIAENSIKQNEANQLASLQRNEELELRNSSLTSTQKIAIQDKYYKMEAEIKRKAFIENQEVSILQAVINGALAVTLATAQTGVYSAFAIPAIIASTAAEVAVIAAQKPPAFATGGVFQSDGKGAVLPGYSRTDNVNAKLRSGEGVVVSEAMRDPNARNAVSKINQAFGGRPFSGTEGFKGWVSPGFYDLPRFAAGGIYSPTYDSGMRPSNPATSGPVRLHNDDISTIISGITGALTGAVSNLPSPTVDVKDINAEQAKLANVTDRVRY